MAIVPESQVNAKRGSATDILSLIRSGAVRTRAELISETGLSRSTVSQRLSQLQEANLIVTDGEALSTGGRPASLLSFNASAGVVLAACLGVTSLRVAVVDLGGSVLAEHSELHRISSGPVATLERLAALGRQLLAENQIDLARVWGYGVGLPGPVEFASGRAVSPPIMPGWDGYPVADWLQEEFGCSALVDNDVNVMGLGEREHGFPDEAQFVYIKVGTGVGAGIIIDGKVHRGAQGSAGDIGHVYVPSHDDVICACGNTGCLEAVVGGRALAAKLSAAGLEAENPDDVVAHVLRGNPIAVHAVRDAGRELGLALAGLVNTINPSVIVLGGAISAAGDYLLAGAREVIYRRSPPLATRSLRIVGTTAHGRAGILGAATMITSAVLEHMVAGEVDEGARLPVSA